MGSGEGNSGAPIASEPRGGFTHESVKNKSVDWYTPAWVFEALGIEFDLDPCSPPGGLPWLPARKHYALPQDGLSLPWEGRVWCNPPYGVHTSKWLRRMSEHRNGIALVFARTDCAWFHDSCASADAILLLRGRIKFVDGLGVSDGNNTAGSGSMFVAWGSDCIAALSNMLDRGLLIQPRWLKDLA